MSPLLLVAGAGVIAGMMNALAGGGSFVTLPALIAVGVPSVTANTTSTVALFPGQLTSAWTYRDGLGSIGPVTLRSLLLATFVGGVIGALLLLRTPITAFDVILPWLLATATLTLAFGRQLGEVWRRRWRINAPLVVAVQFGLGIYGGYFGGGVGIMMMAVWSLLGDRTLKSFNAPRTLLVGDGVEADVGDPAADLGEIKHHRDRLTSLVRIGGFRPNQVSPAWAAKYILAKAERVFEVILFHDPWSPDATAVEVVLHVILLQHRLFQHL